MKVLIDIRTDNAAFTDDPGSEVARILRNLADNIEGNLDLHGFHFTLMDVNGNKVGVAQTVDEED